MLLSATRTKVLAKLKNKPEKKNVLKKCLGHFESCFRLLFISLSNLFIISGNCLLLLTLLMVSGRKVLRIFKKI